jgi:hypothetical protein
VLSLLPVGVVDLVELPVFLQVYAKCIVGRDRLTRSGGGRVGL